MTVTLASVAGRPYVSAMSVQRELRRRLRAEREAATPFAPCLPRLAKMPPVGRDWTHEIKHDGFRIIARRNGGTVRLITRNGYDFAGRFPARCGCNRCTAGPFMRGRWGGNRLR